MAAEHVAEQEEVGYDKPDRETKPGNNWRNGENGDRAKRENAQINGGKANTRLKLWLRCIHTA
jgi:hypothetical protein